MGQDQPQEDHRFIGPFTREIAQFIEDVSRCSPVTSDDLRKLWPDAEQVRQSFEDASAPKAIPSISKGDMDYIATTPDYYPRHCVDGIEEARRSTEQAVKAPLWDMLRERTRAAHENLMARAREFADTLPPGSCVAIAPAQADTSAGSDGMVRMEWTLRPVFPGQEVPPHPWVTYDFSAQPAEDGVSAVQFGAWYERREDQ